MSLIPKDIQDKAAKMNSRYIKGKEFEGEGLLLKCVKFETYKPENSEYGATDENRLVAGELLQEGETFRYTFESPQGDERIHDSSSPGLYFAFQNAELEAENWILIKRTGKSRKTVYTVEKVEAPTQDLSKDVPF